MPIAGTPIRRMSIPTGDDGIDVTIDLMARMAMGKYGARSPLIRDAAVAAVRAAGVDAKDYRAEIDAIHDYVRDRLRYVRDPFGMEMLTHAETLLRDSKDGDCDDHSILEAAMLGAIGVPSRFIVIGAKPDGPFQHVYLAGFDGTRWVPLDPIFKGADKPAGWEVPNPGRKKVYPISTAAGVIDQRPLAAAAALALGAWMLL